MGLFTQILRDSLAKSLHPHQKGNPLTTIGLSPLILGLGLSDNELFKFCLDMAKDLVVHFHPDRYEAAATTVELQRKFAGAFEDLKRRELFDKALVNSHLRRTTVIGEPADPHFMHIVGTEVTDAYPPKSIIRVLKPGYAYEGKEIQEGVVIVATDAEIESERETATPGEEEQERDC